jgi:hypothetical protein
MDDFGRSQRRRANRSYIIPEEDPFEFIDPEDTLAMDAVQAETRVSRHDWYCLVYADELVSHNSEKVQSLSVITGLRRRCINGLELR